MDQRDCSDLCISYFPFWNHLTDTEKGLLAASTREKIYEKGSFLYCGKDECEGVMIIKTGQLRMFITSESGKEVTLFRLHDRDICMLSAACVMDAIKFEVDIEVIEKTTALVVPPYSFRKLAQTDPEVEAFEYKQAALEFSEAMSSIQQILFSAMDKRLAVFLVDESKKTNSSTIYLTQDQIAKFMGTAREVVTRMLRYFSEEGITEVMRGGIRIKDMEKLVKIAGR